MSVRYTARALGQLAEIFDYIAQDNPRAAHAVQLRIKLSFERLDDFPFAGCITDRSGVRVLTVVRYPYPNLLSHLRRGRRSDIAYPPRRTRLIA